MITWGEMAMSALSKDTIIVDESDSQLPVMVRIKTIDQEGSIDFTKAHQNMLDKLLDR